jgi:DNA topoisomerase-3
LLRDHVSNNEWGKAASYLLRIRKDGRPPNTGRDRGDHPPITPLKSATISEVGGGAAWRVYEFICRNFIGSLHQNLEFTRTVAVLQIPGSDEEFELELITVDSLGFAAACPWVLRDIGAKRMESDILKEGDSLPITNAVLNERKQKPPKFLQEHELIREMDSKGIGTGKAIVS